MDLGKRLQADTQFQLNLRQRTTSSDQGLPGDIGPQDFKQNVFSQFRQNDQASEKIGASVIDMYSEGNGKRSRKNLGIQIIGGGPETNNDRLGASVLDGGLTPTMISPLFKKKRHLGGQNVVFDRDSNCETPNEENRRNPFSFNKLPSNGNITPGLRPSGFSLGVNNVFQAPISYVGQHSSSIAHGIGAPLPDCGSGNFKRPLLQLNRIPYNKNNINMPSTNNEQYIRQPSSFSRSSEGSGSSSSSSNSEAASEQQKKGTSFKSKSTNNKKPKDQFQVNVMLTFMNDTMLVKDVPTQKLKSEKILLAPVIEHIKKIGKLLHFKDISYISYKDKMKVAVGVDPIAKTYALPISDLDQTQDPLQIHLVVQDLQQMQNLTINNQIYPMTSIQNTKTININQIKKKLDLEEESKHSFEMQSPEDDDDEFTPNEEINPKKKTPAAVLPKRKGRPPKNLQVITKPAPEPAPRRCGRPRKKPQSFVSEESPSSAKKRNQKLKGKSKSDNSFPQLKGLKTQNDASLVKELNINKSASGKQKRTKERTISDIIEKVSTWRKLYNGIMVPNEQTGELQLQRWSLEDAANKVGVSKKSLDDYLLQLRFGKKFGFDFEVNRDQKVGVLRLFVKKEKEQVKIANGGQKISSKSAENHFYEGELD